MPGKVYHALDQRLIGRLHALILRLRAYVLLDGMIWLTTFLLIAAWVQCTLDYLARGLRFSMRAALLGAVLAGAGYLIWWRLVDPWRTRIGLGDAARLVERRHPSLSSLLISAIRFSSGEVGPRESNSESLMASVIERAHRAVESVDFLRVLDLPRARRRMAMFGAVAVVAACSALASPDMTGLWFARNVLLRDVPWPKRTTLVVETQDGRIVGARGDDIVIQAYAQGEQPRMAELFYETASGEVGRELMVTVGAEGHYRYRYVFKNAREDFRFYLEGGDDRTREIEARLVDRPRIEHWSVRLTPPTYVEIEPFALGEGERSAKILPGTSVAIRFATNKPVNRATLKAGTTAVRDAQPEGEGYVVTFVPEESHTYSFELVDDAGLTNRKPVSFALRLVKDEAPIARMKLPGVGDMITPAAVIPIELAFSDTYGLASVELAYRISKDEERIGVIDLPGFVARVPTFSTSVQWPVVSASVQPGATVGLKAAAGDFNDVTGPGRGETTEQVMRVVTREELLGELARREQEYRQDFERLVDAQEQLRGELLTIFDSFNRGLPRESLMVELAPVERRQRNIAGSVNVVRQQFEQILASLAVNQLDTTDQRERIGTGIIEPLGRLVNRDMVTAADMLRRWAREGAPEEASLVDPQQAALLYEMRLVLDRMLQWEGYHEVVNMLRDILRLQRELNAETKDAVLRDTGDLFDD